MVLHITNKVQDSLGIRELPIPKTDDPKGFLIDWYMNLFYLKKKCFFIFTETTTFYSIIDIAHPINGSKECGNYLLDLASKSLFLETGKVIDLETDIFSIRKTQNNAARRIMIDMIYHAENCNYQNDLSAFDKINDIPQKLLGFHSSREEFISNMMKITNSFEKKLISV